MVLKWTGAFLVTCAGAALGFYYSGQLRNRLHQMIAVRQILYMLKGEIGYSTSTLAEAFGGIAEKTTAPFQIFLKNVCRRMERLEGETLEQIWRQELNRIRNKTSLRGQELREWESLGTRLGYLDRTMQLQLIDLFLMQWEERIRQAEQECRNSCRLYQYMGVLGGLLLTVVLL